MADVQSALRPLALDTCPPRLRKAVQEWLAGRLPNAQLVEVSMIESLDQLDAYEAKPLPTVPEAVAQYRALSRKERHADDLDRLREKYYPFFKQESAVIEQNISNQAWLEGLWTWATRKGLPASVLEQIARVQATHTGAELSA